jgi:CheY-like chemotaxis protein
VLLVEDELLLRMDSAVMIAEAGFELVEAGDADEAIAILESLRDISIVFTDIQMPGSMDRLKLAHAVSGRWPIKIVATSGLVDVGEKDLPRGRTAFCRNRTTRSKLPRCCSNSWVVLFGCHCGAREIVARDLIRE